jgi:hypothetical protein
MKVLHTTLLPIHELLLELDEICEETYRFPTNAASKSKIVGYLGSLRDDLLAYVEYPYVDKVYRNSFYSFFSTKHRDYDRDCIRVSLFENTISKEHFRKPELQTALSKAFLGFVVVRPTMPKLIGRSVISPTAFKRSRFANCSVNIECSVNGVRLISSGFPHSSQDSETIKCAETTVWEIMEYYGNKYPDYSPVLPSIIIAALSGESYERQLPTKGLSVEEISHALKVFGFGVIVYARSIYKEDLKRLFYTYVESGIPVIAAIKNNDVSHAVVAIGRTRVVDDKIEASPVSFVVQDQGRKIEILDVADADREYVLVDDNFPPYQLAKYDDPTAYYGAGKFQKCDLHAIVVPLYHRIYLEGSKARSLITNLLSYSFVTMFLPFERITLRMFLTTGRSFKHKIALDPAIKEDVKEMFLSILLPKFVWVAELSTPELYSRKMAFGVVVLDATESGGNGADSVIFVALPEHFFHVERGKFVPIDFVMEPFSMHLSNLRGDNNNG